MSFLTSICLSNIGSIPQDGLVNIYTNTDNYTTPLLTDVSISDMIGSQCPYTLSVPDGTTEIRIIHLPTSTRICLQVVDPCFSCNLGFDEYEQNSIGQLIVGNLTGSCDTITDYFINWYGPNDGSYDPMNPGQNIAFTSGHGTEFPGYNYLHPMVGTQSPPMIPGHYIPVISKVKINDVIYSLTGGTGTTQSNLDCLYPTIIISAYTCSDTNITGDYSTQINFTTTGEASIPPNSLSTVLKIGTNINYLAIYFNGFDIADTLKIQFSGSSYSTPLTLEYIRSGKYINDDFSVSSMPKSKYGIFKKVLNLTGLIRTLDDYLLISVIPNQSNNATSWLLKWKCLETFDCYTCIDNYKNSPYKIFGSTISSSESGCNVFNYRLRLTGCFDGGFSSYMPGKYFNYFNNYLGTLAPNGTWDFRNSINTNTVNCYGVYPQSNVFCREDAPGSGTITTSKLFDGTNDILKFTFTDINDFNTYYTSYSNSIFFYSGNPTNPLSIDYYRAYQVQICVVGETQNCGDNSTKFTLWIHPSSVLTTGFTNGEYSMTMTMPKITKQITFTNCELDCDYIVSLIVNKINDSANFGEFLITSNVGARFTQLSYGAEYVYKYVSHGNSSNIYGQIAVYYYSYRTYVYSGDSPSYIIIPSLTSTTCSYDIAPSVSSTSNYAYLNTNSYRVFLPDTNNLGYFNIYGKPINNWNLGAEELVYVYSAGTVQYSNPNFIV